MKNILFTALLTVSLIQGNAQNINQMEKEKIESVITAFANAVDNSDIQTAAGYLHPDFRVVLGNFQNSGNTVILTKEKYLGMIKEGKVGGNKRTISILITDVQQEAALVKVKLEGAKNIFINYYSLLKKEDGWLIVNDIPQITSKQ